jgi:FixH protein
MTAPRPTARYQLLLGAVVTLFLAGMVASFVVAARRVSAVTDPDYYEQGLRYAAAARKGAAADLAGWRMSVAHDGETLRVTVADKGGALIRRGEARFFPETSSAARLAPLSLSEDAGGVYRLPFPVSSAAGVRGELVFGKEGREMSRKVVINP